MEQKYTLVYISKPGTTRTRKQQKIHYPDLSMKKYWAGGVYTVADDLGIRVRYNWKAFHQRSRILQFNTFLKGNLNWD